MVYDDQGQTDWYCTRFDIDVQAVLNFNYLDLIFPALQGKTENPAVIMKAIRTALLRPRRQLTVSFNGVNLIPNNTAGDGTVDVRNGPQPQSCNLTQLTDTTFLCTYRIVAHYWENNKVDGDANPIVSNQTGNDVLYNRWQESVEMDSAMYTRRIREGKFVIRSDNAGPFIADQLRTQMAVVGVPQGFLRESSNYTVSPDGLAIMYRIVDKEVFKNPPQGAHEAEGEYYESAPINSPLRYLYCRVKLRGAKNFSQADLIERAVKVATAKVSANGEVLNPKEGALPLEFGVRVGMYENTVEVNLRAMVVATKQRTNSIVGSFSRLTWTPLSDPIPPELDPNGVGGGQRAPTPTYLDAGTAGVVLKAAAYYDPSIQNNTLDKTTGQMTQGLEPGTAGKNQE